MDPVRELAQLGREIEARSARLPGPRQPDDLGFAEGAGLRPEPDVIVANGSGDQRVPPDLVVVSLGVDAQATTLTEAQQEAAGRMQSVLAALKGLRLKSLVVSTSRMDLRSVYADRGAMIRFTEELPQVVGYRASAGVIATVRGLAAEQLAQTASQIVDLGAGAGANRIEGVSFSLERPEVPAREARKLAVKDARANADAMAEAAGVTLAALHSITDVVRGWDGGTRAFAGAVALHAKGPESATPVEAGEIVVERSVVVRWYFSGASSAGKSNAAEEPDAGLGGRRPR